jgi:hypothetical protein
LSELLAFVRVVITSLSEVLALESLTLEWLALELLVWCG